MPFGARGATLRSAFTLTFIAILHLLICQLSLHFLNSASQVWKAKECSLQVPKPRPGSTSRTATHAHSRAPSRRPTARPTAALSDCLHSSPSDAPMHPIDSIQAGGDRDRRPPRLISLVVCFGNGFCGALFQSASFQLCREIGSMLIHTNDLRCHPIFKHELSKFKTQVPWWKIPQND